MPLRSVEAATRDDAIVAAREQFGATARVVGVRRVRSGGVLGFFATERYVAEVDPDAPVRPGRPTPARTPVTRAPSPSAPPSTMSLEERARAAAASIAALAAAAADPVDEVADLLGSDGSPEPLPTYTRSTFQRAAAETAKNAAVAPAAAAAKKATRAFMPEPVTQMTPVREWPTVETDDEGPVVSGSGESASPSPFTAALARMVSGDREVRQAVQEALDDPADERRDSEPSRPNWAAIVRAAEKTAQSGAPHQEEEPVDEQEEQSPGVRPMVFPTWAADAPEPPAPAPVMVQPAGSSPPREDVIADILRAALAQGQSDEALADILRTVLAGSSPAEPPRPVETFAETFVEPVVEAPVIETPVVAPSWQPEPVLEVATYEPTYEAPTYEAPTYEAPTYEAPTYEPVYEAATFEPATFEAPTFEAPTFEPAFEAPTFEPATFEAPTYEPSYAAPTFEPATFEPAIEVQPLWGNPAPAAPVWAAPAPAEPAEPAWADVAADEPVFAEVVLHEPAAPVAAPMAAAPVSVPVAAAPAPAPAVAEHPVVQRPVAVAAPVEARPVEAQRVEEQPVAQLPMPPLARTASDPAPMPLDATTVMPPLSLLPPLSGRRGGGLPPVPPVASRPSMPSAAATAAVAPAPSAPTTAPMRTSAPLATVVRLPFAPLPDVDFIEHGEPAAPEVDDEETPMSQPVLVEPIEPLTLVEPLTETLTDPLTETVVDAEPAPPATAPMPAVPAPSGDVAARLVSFGLTEQMLGAGFAADAAAHGTYAALTAALTARLPVAPELPTGPGEVLFLVGPGVETLRAARSLAASLRLDPERVQWATRGDLAALAPKGSRMTTIDAAIDRRQDAARAGTMTIVAVDAPLRTDAYWMSQMLAIWSPSAVWAVVEATRKPEDLEQWLGGLPRADALVVQDTDLSADPAAVLARVDTPVALLDGVPATAHRWASVLCERLETREA